MVTAKKATTNRTKSEFLSQCRIAAKTNFLFPARFEHARYSSRMIDRFLTGAIMETEKRQDQRPLPATAWTILILAGKRDSRRHLILQVIKCYKFHHFAIGSEARSTYFTSGGKKYSDFFRYVYFWRIRKKKKQQQQQLKSISFSYSYLSSNLQLNLKVCALVDFYHLLNTILTATTAETIAPS